MQARALRYDENINTKSPAFVSMAGRLSRVEIAVAQASLDFVQFAGRRLALDRRRRRAAARFRTTDVDSRRRDFDNCRGRRRIAMDPANPRQTARPRVLSARRA